MWWGVGGGSSERWKETYEAPFYIFFLLVLPQEAEALAKKAQE